MKTPDRTLSQVQNELNLQGYEEQFRTHEGAIQAIRAKKDYTPEQLKIVDKFLFDGMTNPEDESELFAIQTEDGIKGTLVVSWGKDQSTDDAELIKRIKEVERME